MLRNLGIHPTPWGVYFCGSQPRLLSLVPTIPANPGADVPKLGVEILIAACALLSTVGLAFAHAAPGEKFTTGVSAGVFVSAAAHLKIIWFVKLRIFTLRVKSLFNDRPGIQIKTDS